MSDVFQPTPQQLDLQQRLQLLLALNSGYVVEIVGLGREKLKKIESYLIVWASDSHAVCIDIADSGLCTRLVFVKEEEAKEALAMSSGVVDAGAKTGLYLKFELSAATPADWPVGERLWQPRYDNRFFLTNKLDYFSASFDPSAFLAQYSEVSTLWDALTHLLPLPVIGLFTCAGPADGARNSPLPGLSQAQAAQLLASLLPLPSDSEDLAETKQNQDGDVVIADATVQSADDITGVQKSDAMVQTEKVGIVEASAAAPGSAASTSASGPAVVAPPNVRGAYTHDFVPSRSSRSGRPLEQLLTPALGSTGTRRYPFACVLLENVSQYYLDHTEALYNKVRSLGGELCFCGKPDFLVEGSTVVVTFYQAHLDAAARAVERINKDASRDGMRARFYDGLGRIQVEVKWTDGSSMKMKHALRFVEESSIRSGYQPESAILLSTTLILLYRSEWISNIVVALMNGFQQSFAAIPDAEGHGRWHVSLTRELFDFVPR
ncbi:hypothetical protein JCM10296v2_003928 [Rhodotorula toruloides]